MAPCETPELDGGPYFVQSELPVKVIDFLKRFHFSGYSNCEISPENWIKSERTPKR
jgi:hypothetical protein